MIRGNLATRPFYNERAAQVLLGVFALLVAFLTIFNVVRVVTLSSRNTTLSVDIRRDEETATRLRREAAQIRGHINQQELEQVMDGAREANALIDRRTFSWTEFFNLIERTLPENVMLTSVSPSVDKGRTIVSMTVLGRRAEDIDAFMEQLEGTKAFLGVQPLNEDLNEDGLHRMQLSAEYMRKNLVTARLSGVLWPLIAVFSGLGTAVVLWLGGRRVLLGTLTIGQFVQFSGYLAMLTWPVMAIGYVVNLYQRGSAALTRLVEVLETPPAPAHLTPDDGSPRRLTGAVEFRNLSFRYDAEAPWILRDIELKVSAGSLLAIVGEVGAGKSTLVHLIARLFEVPEGSLLLDGRDIRAVPLSRLRASIGLVSQDIFLFSETIRENILFGRPDATVQDMEEAARIAALLPSIQEFADRFDTLLGERGVRLSGGQKQRTALARALVADPPILILDDAFSSVDVQTEESILRECLCRCVLRL